MDKKELKDFTERVMKLLDKEIDQLWFNCGWRTEDHEEGFKSLREEDIRQIRRGFDFAKQMLNDLLFTISPVTFKRKLIRIENGYDMH